MKSIMIFLVALTSSFGWGQNEVKSAKTTIAIVDLTKVFEVHPETAKATTQLTKDREAARDLFKEKSNSLKEVLQSHQELIREGKREEATGKLKEANELEKAIATLRTTQQRDLEEKFRQTKSRILDEITRTVRSFNDSGKYSLILDSSSKSSNGLPQVIDASGVEDITETIIKLVSASE